MTIAIKTLTSNVSKINGFKDEDEKIKFSGFYFNSKLNFEDFDEIKSEALLKYCSLISKENIKLLSKEIGGIPRKIIVFEDISKEWLDVDSLKYLSRVFAVDVFANINDSYIILADIYNKLYYLNKDNLIEEIK
jgi:hypothetical protein